MLGSLLCPCILNVTIMKWSWREHHIFLAMWHIFRHFAKNGTRVYNSSLCLINIPPKHSCCRYKDRMVEMVYLKQNIDITVLAHFCMKRPTNFWAITQHITHGSVQNILTQAWCQKGRKEGQLLTNQRRQFSSWDFVIMRAVSGALNDIWVNLKGA